MRIRPMQVFSAVAVLIAAVAGATLLMRPPGAEPPTATASPPAPTAAISSSAATPASTPTPSAAPGSERYGLILDGRPPVIRSEADPRKLGELTGEYFYGAISPDGRAIAYWEVPSGAFGGDVLRVVHGSAPTQPRVVLTLPDDEFASTSTGGGVVWSTDGTALLFGASRSDPTPGRPHAPHLYSALREVHLASGSVREVVRVAPSLALRPVAWDRGRGIAAAIEIGGGGYVANYVVARQGAAPTRTSFGMEIGANDVRAAPDASRIFAVSQRPVSALHVWPLAEPDRRKTLAVRSGEQVGTAMWRNEREILVSMSTRDDGRTDRLEVWPLEGQRRVILHGLHDLQAVRPDGTAAIIHGHIVDLDTTAGSPIPGLTGRVAASFLLR